MKIGSNDGRRAGKDGFTAGECEAAGGIPGDGICVLEPGETLYEVSEADCAERGGTSDISPEFDVGRCHIPSKTRPITTQLPPEQIDVGVEYDDGFGVSLAVGKPINRWLNLELYGYYFFDTDMSFKFSTGQSYSGDGDMWGIGADALLFPARNVVPVYGIVGASWGEMQADRFSTPLGEIGGDADAYNLDVGVGYLHTLNDYCLKLRAEYRYRYTSVDADDWFGDTGYDTHNGHFNSNILSVGLQIPLGAPPQAPVEPEPAPEPVMETVTLSADALFAFDRGDLSGMLPGAEADLNNLVNKITSGYVEINSLVVEGHTDRLGADAYNARLSQQRADTVGRYLQAHGVTAPIRAVGMGENHPVKTGCEGSVATNALIACLQPNRRVEVVIKGLRKQ